MDCMYGPSLTCVVPDPRQPGRAEWQVDSPLGPDGIRRRTLEEADQCFGRY